MEEKIYYLKDQQTIGMAEWIKGLNASGYAGCLPNGWIVDRREYPEAHPIAANSMFGVVEPKKLDVSRLEGKR